MNAFVKPLLRPGETPASPAARERIGKFSGILGIALNTLLAAGKIAAGALSGLISVLADGLNNLTDCGSNVVSVIGFKTCDQGREKFQGASLDFVWFDEEPPKDVYDECRMRLLDRAGELFGTMTPLKGRTFLYDEIYLNARGDPEVWYEFMAWEDNPFLPRREIALLEKTLDARTLESRRRGRFCTGEGLVYPEFDERVHVIPPFAVPPEWQDAISIDPGLNNPLSAHWYCADWDGNVYVVAEHYEAGRDVEYHARRIREISRALGWHTDGQGRLRVGEGGAHCSNSRTATAVMSSGGAPPVRESASASRSSASACRRERSRNTWSIRPGPDKYNPDPEGACPHPGGIPRRTEPPGTYRSEASKVPPDSAFFVPARAADSAVRLSRNKKRLPRQTGSSGIPEIPESCFSAACLPDNFPDTLPPQEPDNCDPAPFYMTPSFPALLFD